MVVVVVSLWLLSSDQWHKYKDHLEVSPGGLHVLAQRDAVHTRPLEVCVPRWLCVAMVASKLVFPWLQSGYSIAVVAIRCTHIDIFIN